MTADRDSVSMQSPVASVTAETAYPISAASARVRIAAFAPHLLEHGIDLKFQPNLTDAEYEVVASGSGPLRKACELGRASGRVIRRTLSQREQGPLLVHRLRFLVPLPGIEPARSP